MGFEPTTFSLARRRTTAVLRPRSVFFLTEKCRDTELNCGHRDFQSRALPTELSRPDILLLSVRDFTRREGDCQARDWNGIASLRESILARDDMNPPLLLTSACFRTTMPT
jgi:hypothetical protein